MDKLAQVDIGANFGSPFGISGGKTLGDLVSLLVTASLTIAGLYFLFMFVGGGVQMIQNAGSGDSKSVAAGKQAITSAFVGFAIIFMAYWVIRIIELVTGLDFITAPGL